jgi:hypothetical protein
MSLSTEKQTVSTQLALWARRSGFAEANELV